MAPTPKEEDLHAAVLAARMRVRDIFGAQVPRRAPESEDEADALQTMIDQENRFKRKYLGCTN